MTAASAHALEAEGLCRPHVLDPNRDDDDEQCSLEAGATSSRQAIVMELLAGESLESRVDRRGRLSTLDAVTLGRQIAVSLAAAHAKNIVHRDLKPENVFVVPDLAVSGGERTKVLDFGIAKLGTTQTGEWFGTPVYASPEQCRSAADADQRSDIYSLGCMLFFIVTGEPPFEADVTNEVVAAHLRDLPRHASATATAVAPSSSIDTAENVVAVPAKRKAKRRTSKRKKEGPIRVERYMGYVDRDD